MRAAPLALAVLFVALAWFAPHLINSPGPLDGERGRRAALQKIRKSSWHYDALGVSSHEEYYINARGVEVFTKQWLPRNGTVKGVVLYLHGYSATCAYLWDESAVALAQSQFLVLGLDHEGFGRSSGLHGHIASFNSLVDDVIELSDALQAHPGIASLPFFLFGESMGGALAIKAHWRRPKAWRGAVLMAPMVKLDDELVPPPAAVFVLRAVAKILPTWKLVPQGRDLAAESFRDPRKRQLARASPVACAGRMRLSTGEQILQTTLELGSSMGRVTLPLLLLHGARDVITNASMTQALYEAAQSQDKTLKLYGDSWHGLLSGEPDDVVKEVMGDIVGWLNARAQAGSRTLRGPVSPVGVVPDAELLQAPTYSTTSNS